MDNEVFEQAEMAFLAAREQVSNDELIARMNSAPDLGGARRLSDLSPSQSE